MMTNDEQPDSDLGYRLVLTVRGPHHHDEVVIESEQTGDFIPDEQVWAGVTYQRYGGEGAGCFVEIQSDHVVARRVEPIEAPPPEPTPPDLDDPHDGGLPVGDGPPTENLR